MKEEEYIKIFNQIAKEAKPDFEKEIKSLDDDFSTISMDSLDIVVFLVILEASFEIPSESLDDKMAGYDDDGGFSFGIIVSALESYGKEITYDEVINNL